MKRALFGAILLVTMTASYASATALTVTGTNGGSLSASATFTDLGGGVLRVVLTNTGLAASVPADGLTAVFWDGTTGLTPFSAFLNTGSSFVSATNTCIVAGCNPNNDGNVGGEYAYAQYNRAGGGTESGISSSGFSVFGAGNFNGPNLEDPNAVDGINFALVNGLSNPNGGMAGNPLIQNSVVFLLTYTGASFDPSTLIHNVQFQYGTSFSEPNFPGTPGTGTGTGTTGRSGTLEAAPEPASMVLLGTGLVAVATRLRRKRAKSVQIQ
jgi:hypothetical protein